MPAPVLTLDPAVAVAVRGKGERARVFERLAEAPLDLGPNVREEDAPALEPWVRAWYRWASAAYLGGYREATAGAAFLPSDAGEWATVLDAMLFHKAFYELGYELNNRPDWVAIPLRGIAQLLEP